MSLFTLLWSCFASKPYRFTSRRISLLISSVWAWFFTIFSTSSAIPSFKELRISRLRDSRNWPNKASKSWEYSWARLWGELLPGIIDSLDFWLGGEQRVGLSLPALSGDYLALGFDQGLILEEGWDLESGWLEDFVGNFLACKAWKEILLYDQLAIEFCRVYSGLLEFSTLSLPSWSVVLVSYQANTYPSCKKFVSIWDADYEFVSSIWSSE